MPMLEGGSTATRQRGEQQNQPGGAGRPLYDLVLRALMGNVMEPQATDIPVPLQQAVSGYQDMMPALMAQAFGGPTSLASRLSPASPSSSASPTPTAAASGASWMPDSFGGATGKQTFGMQSREQLGLGKPSVTDPRFLPPTDSILEELPPVRTSQPTRRASRATAKLEGMQAKRDARADAGLGTGRLDRKIAKKERRMERRFYE